MNPRVPRVLQCNYHKPSFIILKPSVDPSVPTMVAPKNVGEPVLLYLDKTIYAYEGETWRIDGVLDEDTYVKHVFNIKEDLSVSSIKMPLCSEYHMVLEGINGFTENEVGGGDKEKDKEA
jgi:hypothetical protein